jgi:polar amino acid transport system substrate-binding protein
MKKYTKIIIIATIFLLMLTACAQKDRLDAIKEAGKIVVGTSADYEPWEYKDENDNFVGADMEIMTELARRMGVTVEFQDLGFDTLVAAVQEGKVDAAIAAMASTDERKQQVDFSMVYYAGDNVVLTKADSGIDFDDPMAMADYKIGTQTGTIMQYWVEENLIEPGLMSSNNLFLYERNEQVALDLSAGRIDVAMMDLEPGKQFLADTQFNFVELLRQPFDPNGQAIAIMKGEDDLAAEINKHLQDMLADGFIRSVLDKYGIE